MRSKERPIIEEVPLIGVSPIVATVALAAASALPWSVRGVLHLARLDRATGATGRRTA
jgi:hypothetical protein